MSDSYMSTTVIRPDQFSAVIGHLPNLVIIELFTDE